MKSSSPVMSMRTGVIDEPLAGMRLAQAAAHMFRLSRKEAALCIAEGRLQVGRDVCRIQAKRVRAGQVLRMQASRADGAERTTNAKPALQILYLSRELCVVNKPAGLLSEKDRFGAPSVESLLANMLAARGERKALWLVHRLDAGTSGVLVLARTLASARRLFAAFRERRVQKMYLALTARQSEGSTATPPASDQALATTLLSRGHAQITAPLTKDRGTRHRVARPEEPAGKPAVSRVIVDQTAARGHLVVVYPLTGRTHQIRVHLAHVGLPILGDGLYGGARYIDDNNEARVPVTRTLLHAGRIRIPDPRADAAPDALLSFDAPVPDDFEAIAMALGIDDRVQAAPWEPPPKNAAPKKHRDSPPRPQTSTRSTSKASKIQKAT